MNEVFEKFLLVDATYKLIDLGIPVYFLFVAHRDGLSEIAALFVLVG